MKLGPLVSPCQWHPPGQLIPAFLAPQAHIFFHQVPQA